MKHTQIAVINNPVISGNLTGNEDGGTSLGIIMGNLYQTIVMVGALALLIYIIWGGINWIMAGGDATKIEDAKNKITNAIIGMAILVATIAIVNVMSGVFGFDLLNPIIPKSSTITSPGI